MKKTTLLVVNIGNPGAHAAEALIRKTTQGQTNIHPTDYKPAATKLLVIEEDETLILGFNGRLDKIAVAEKISLPRAAARYITKNENTAPVKKFLKTVERMLANSTAVESFAGVVNRLLTIFPPAIAVRTVTPLFEEIFTLSDQGIANESFTTESFGSEKSPLVVATVANEETNPFASSLVLDEKVGDNLVDAVIQETTTAVQISFRPSFAPLAKEIANKIHQKALAMGDGLNIPQEIGNTLTFNKTAVAGGGTFPTLKEVCNVTKATCKTWTSVSADTLQKVTA